MAATRPSRLEPETMLLATITRRRSIRSAIMPAGSAAIAAPARFVAVTPAMTRGLRVSVMVKSGKATATGRRRWPRYQWPTKVAKTPPQAAARTSRPEARPRYRPEGRDGQYRARAQYQAPPARPCPKMDLPCIVQSYTSAPNPKSAGVRRTEGYQGKPCEARTKCWTAVCLPSHDKLCAPTRSGGWPSLFFSQE